jgi:hypothetical protein
MSLSFRNLFKGLGGRAAARTSPRPSLKTRLQVERLEGRELPTAMIAFYNFPIYNAAQVKTGNLYISNEIPSTGQFWGTFEDLSQGLNIAVTGQLKQISSSWDTMTFKGSGGSVFNNESVNFTGWVTENSLHWMEGTLTQTYQSYCWPLGGYRIWSTSTFEVSLGSPPLY